MAAKRCLFALLGSLALCSLVNAQAPGVIYTWPGTNNIAQWTANGPNYAVITNDTAGQITATEMGDQLDPTVNVGAEVFIHDEDHRRLESSNDIGGLDLTGLTYLEMDIGHNSPTATVSVQFYVKANPNYLYQWGGSDGALQGPDWALGPGMHTIRFPINQLTAANQAYIPEIGVDVRAHTDVGNLVWTISELRAVGTPLTSRVIASHDAGTSDNGLNGAFINFDAAAVKNGTGNQDQVGLSQVNNGGVGSMQWTDKGGDGTAASPSGAAIGWVNGTFFGGNTYNERPLSADNYNQVIYRMKATDPLNQGGTINIQSYFQTEGYSDFQTGTQTLPVDGQYHDLVFSLTGFIHMKSIDAFGVNLGAHANDAIIDVDSVRFNTAQGVPGDYNNNGTVDAADYVLWRKGLALQNEVATLGSDTPEDYTEWRARFGNITGLGAGTVPEPSTSVLILLSLAAALPTIRSKRGS